jgi:F-type H+-transporting ATPase subunit b
MRFWTAYALLALGVVSKAWASSEGHGGEHHASITDLIAPAINVAILFAALIYATKDKLKSYFVSKSEEVANTLIRADIKSKEAQILLDNQKRKMAALESEVKSIHAQAETEVANYEKFLSKETADKLAKMKTDSESKVMADKKQMMDELNAELLQQVISKAKTTIKNNQDYKSKVSTKMLQGLR